MTLESFIEAVRNRKTQKLFILVDDALELRYKVINPSGEVLILPDVLFDEDPVTVSSDRFATEFTPEQLAALARYNEQVASQAPVVAPPPPAEPAASKPRSETRRRSRSSSAGPVRRGLGASWSAPRLTFYRHKIEPLHPKQSFRISVEGIGDFEITKEEFLAHFNDAVMSASYRSEGLYSYSSFPEKARRYLRS